jgi:ribosomal protein S18 acetylase RimI-like enzyme
MFHIYPSRSEKDAALLLELWGKVFGETWPVDPAWFHAVTMSTSWLPGDHLVAEEAGHAIGFVLTQLGNGISPGGSILATGVLPEYRRRGVGRALHQAALEHVRKRGAVKIGLGAGALEYFWPGVPLDQPGAWAFFQSLGWMDQERSFDLVRSLENYHTPSWVWERVSSLGIDFMPAEALSAGDVIAFVAVESAGWKAAYSSYFDSGRARDVLLARRRADGQIVGACLLQDEARRWAARFPRPLGAPGCFLVGEKWQGQGIGMALVARACEVLQARGCKACFIGWTWLVDWYGKLGFEVWQENVMSWRSLSSQAG